MSTPHKDTDKPSGGPRPRKRGSSRKRQGSPVSAPPSEDALERFEAHIGYAFKNRGHLIEALTHASADTGSRLPRRAARVNERFEFLGDRVLGLMAAESLFKAFGDAPEGALAPRLNALVRKETCAEVAQEAGMGPLLILAEAEEGTGGREKTAILGDACEALIAALYLDGGFKAAHGFFDRFWGARVTTLEAVPRDPKTRLQEWAQARWRVTPSYAVLEREGPDHAPEFVIEVSIPGVAPARGTGPSKRHAEQAAAAAILEREGVTAGDEDGAS